MDNGEVPVVVSLPSVTIDLHGFCEMIYDAVPNENFPSLVRDTDLLYSDFDTTQKTIELLLDSIRLEFVVSGDKKELDKWDETVETIRDMMNEFN